MIKTLSDRGQISSFLAMDVMEAASQVEATGKDVIHMEVGQPGTPAPQAALSRLSEAMAGGDPLGYTVALGLPALRSGISDLYQSRYGLAIDPARIVITPGSSGAFILAFLGCFDPGARLALADPGYPAYRNILSALGLQTVRIETGRETRFQPVPEMLEAAGPLDGLLVASPGNPTGTMLGAEEMAALSGFCADRGIPLISDEIYHGLSYGVPAVTALSTSNDAIVINSFAKYFSMTGWRVGWMVVPEAMIRTMESLAQSLFICSSHASQVAALGALSPEAAAELEGHKAVYAANRARLLEALPGLGFDDIAPPDGAFYIYADIAQLSNDSRDFCDRLLRHGGVAATPGLDFDPVRGHRTMRFSFARTEAEIIEGIERIKAFVADG